MIRAKRDVHPVLYDEVFFYEHLLLTLSSSTLTSLFSRSKHGPTRDVGMIACQHCMVTLYVVGKCLDLQVLQIYNDIFFPLWTDCWCKEINLKHARLREFHFVNRKSGRENFAFRRTDRHNTHTHTHTQQQSTTLNTSTTFGSRNTWSMCVGVHREWLELTVSHTHSSHARCHVHDLS